MSMAGVIVSVVAVIVSSASFITASLANRRARKAEDIQALLGEKETVAFAGLKLLESGLPTDGEQRRILIRAVIQACVFESSDRARALLYRVIECNRDAHRPEFEAALDEIVQTFASMNAYGFNSEELDLRRGERRVSAVQRVIAGVL